MISGQGWNDCDDDMVTKCKPLAVGVPIDSVKSNNTTKQAVLGGQRVSQPKSCFYTYSTEKLQFFHDKRKVERIVRLTLIKAVGGQDGSIAVTHSRLPA